MSKQMWLVVGIMAAVAIVTGYLVKTKSETSETENAVNSQLPADAAAANYNVPPDIGASVDVGGGISFPSGQGTVYTVSQGNSLPMTPYTGS